LAGVVRRVHLGVDSRDFPLLVDEIADACRITSPEIAARSISQTNFAVGIAQQAEWEMVLAGKSGVRGNIIEANAENDDAAVFESSVLVAEPATLACSASGIGLRIKPQKNLAATQG